MSKRKKIRTLLVSMPAANYHLPSLQIGALSAYARQRNFQVECRNLHLEMATHFGLKEYDKIFRHHLFELFFIYFLFPQNKKQVRRYLQKYFCNIDYILKQISKTTKLLYNTIDWKKYDLVGFTANYYQLFSTLLFSKWLKRDFPHLKIVLGGPLVEGTLGCSILKHFKEIDWCVNGEGEIAFTKLLSCLSRRININRNVPGLIYRHNNSICCNLRLQIHNLKHLPDPDYDEYFHVLQKNKLSHDKMIMPIIPIEGSRGCIYKCAFCSRQIYWNGYRIRPPIEVANQLKRLSKRYCTNLFQFVDSLVPPIYYKQLFPLIENHNHDYNIFYEVRADAKKKQLKLMRRAGVRLIQLGIEALSTNLLCKMNKGTRTIQNLQIMKYCEELGIEHDSNLMIAFPTESQNDINETIKNIKYALAYRPPKQLAIFRLDHNSVIYRNAKEYGITQIQNILPTKHILPPPLGSSLSLTVKKFRTGHKKRNYKNLRKIMRKWQREYNKSLLNNTKLLRFYDCGSFLKIEDRRPEIEKPVYDREYLIDITLEGTARNLYLFCDSIKGFNEIKKRFAKWGTKKIRKALNELVRLKVMFSEDDDYLSLAIHDKSRKI